MDYTSIFTLDLSANNCQFGRDILPLCPLSIFFKADLIRLKKRKRRDRRSDGNEVKEKERERMMCRLLLEFVRRVAVVLLYLLLAMLHLIEIPFSLLGSLLYLLLSLFCFSSCGERWYQQHRGGDVDEEDRETTNVIDIDVVESGRLSCRKRGDRRREGRHATREVPPFRRAKLNWFCVKLLMFCLYTYVLPWSHPMANRFDFHHLSYGVAFLLLHPFERLLRFGQWMTFDSIVNYDAVGIFGWRNRLFFSLDYSSDFTSPHLQQLVETKNNNNNNNEQEEGVDDGDGDGDGDAHNADNNRKPSYAFPSIDDVDHHRHHLQRHHRQRRQPNYTTTTTGRSDPQPTETYYSLKTSPSYVLDHKGRPRFVRKSDGTLEQISRITFFLPIADESYDDNDDKDGDKATEDEENPSHENEKQEKKTGVRKLKGNAFPADNFFVDYWREFLGEMFCCWRDPILLDAVTEKKDQILDQVAQPEYEKILRHPETRLQPLLHVPFDVFK